VLQSPATDPNPACGEAAIEVFTDIRSLSLAEVPEQARRVEAMGFDGLLFNETVSDPFLAATLAAEHTQGMRLGTSIALAFPRSPMAMAYTCWGLQALAHGRFHLGLGSQVRGHMERRFSVPWSAPAARMGGYVKALKAIWDCWQNGTALSYQGQHYSFSLMTPFFNPGPLEHATPQVYVAAVGPVMCRVAGEAADGVLLHSLVSAKYVHEVVLPNLEQGASRAGKTLGDLTIGGGGFIIVSDDQESLRRSYEAARQRIAFYASTPAYRVVMEVHGWGAVADQLRQLSFESRWDEMPRLVTDEMMAVFCVVGSRGEIAAQLRKRYGDHATRITIPLPEDLGREDTWLREVVQALHGAGVPSAA
jgi:probable F420-dependent oxidoreductase